MTFESKVMQVQTDLRFSVQHSMSKNLNSQTYPGGRGDDLVKAFHSGWPTQSVGVHFLSNIYIFFMSQTYFDVINLSIQDGGFENVHWEGEGARLCKGLSLWEADKIRRCSVSFEYFNVESIF